MLPDFEGMVATPANRFTSRRLVAGVQAHHATDHVFHCSEPFLRHQTQARLELKAVHLRTGPRRGVAHVGVELLLDAALSRAAERTACYKAALRTGLQPAALAGAPLLARAKLTSLLTTLSARVAHVVPRTPEDVALRLARIFASRPALALETRELPLITAWARRAWTPIADEAEVWLGQLVELAAQRLNTHGNTVAAGCGQTPTRDTSALPTSGE